MESFPDLIKEDIVRLISQRGYVPINACEFYYNKHNLDLLLNMWEEGILVSRGNKVIDFELA
mgnify:CR=1 FL=1